MWSIIQVIQWQFILFVLEMVKKIQRPTS